MTVRITLTVGGKPVSSMTVVIDANDWRDWVVYAMTHRYGIIFERLDGSGSTVEMVEQKGEERNDMFDRR